MAEDEFITRIASELRTLEARDAALAATEENIRRERAEIRGRVGDLARVVTVYREFMGLVNKTVAPVSMWPEMAGSGSNGTKPTRTIADIAEAYLADHGGRAKVSDIVAELVRLKRLTGKHSDYGTVFGTLSRNPRRFMKVATGEFAVMNPSAPEKA
jgi:hypothetical protein